MIIVGAGPTGLTWGAVLARRGHRVVAVDRDPGPGRRRLVAASGRHAVRAPARLPPAGARPAAGRVARGVADLARTRRRPDRPGPSRRLHARSSASARVARPTSAPCAAPPPTSTGSRSRSATWTASSSATARWWAWSSDGAAVERDLVIDAGGRVSRLSARGVADLGGDTGMAYVTRTYRRHRGAGPGPMAGPVAWTGIFDGYQVYVFPHEHGHFSVVFIRPTADAELDAAPPRRCVRRRLPGHPRPGRLDRPGARRAHQRRAGRRPAAQRLPPPARPTRPGGGG